MEPKTQAKVTTEKIVLKEILRWLDTNSCTTKYCKPEYAYSVLLYLLIYILHYVLTHICNKYCTYLQIFKSRSNQLYPTIFFIFHFKLTKGVIIVKIVYIVKALVHRIQIQTKFMFIWLQQKCNSQLIMINIYFLSVKKSLICLIL